MVWLFVDGTLILFFFSFHKDFFLVVNSFFFLKYMKLCENYNFLALQQQINVSGHLYSSQWVLILQPEVGFSQESGGRCIFHHRNDYIGFYLCPKTAEQH